MVYTDPLGICYALIMGLGMSNLLVAMFADSYVNVQSNAKVEYNFLRFQRITEMHEVLMRTPPPFNVLFVIWDLTKFALRGLCYGLCSIRKKQSGTLKQQNAKVASQENAEKLAHRLVDLFLSAQDTAQESSVEGLITSCREMLRDERVISASRYQKLISLSNEMSAMMSQLCAVLPAVTAETNTMSSNTTASIAPTSLTVAEYFAGQGSLSSNTDGQYSEVEAGPKPPAQATPAAPEEPHFCLAERQAEPLGRATNGVAIPSTGGIHGSPYPGSVLRAPRSGRSGRRANWNIDPVSVVQL